MIAVFALYALAIYLARGRRRLLLGATGASLVFVGLVIASLRRFLGDVVVDSLVKTEANKHPVSVIWAIETSVLRDIAIILVVYGALVLLATVFAGPNRPAVALRRWLAPSFRHHPIVVWAAALFLFLILLAWGPTAGEPASARRRCSLPPRPPIAIEALRRQTLREFPEDSPRPSRRLLERPNPDLGDARYASTREERPGPCERPRVRWPPGAGAPSTRSARRKRLRPARGRSQPAPARRAQRRRRSRGVLSPSIPPTQPRCL